MSSADMSIRERLPMPKRLSSRVWLLTLPSALLSFERRQKIPPLPIGPARFLGIPLIALGIAISIWATQKPDVDVRYPRTLSRLPSRPATLGGLVALAGAAILLRSLVLSVYSLGLVLAAGSDVITIEEPDPRSFVRNREE
jgi:hypothetical protein